MSDEIIYISSDDEEACIENSTEAGITSVSSKKHIEYQFFSTYDGETWRKMQVKDAEEMCTYYEEKVKKAQEEVSDLEKYTEKVKSQTEESQTKLLNFLDNPAYSHLEDIIITAINNEKTRYRLSLEEVAHSKDWLKKLEKQLAIHKYDLKMLMPTENS